MSSKWNCGQDRGALVAVHVGFGLSMYGDPDRLYGGREYAAFHFFLTLGEGDISDPPRSNAMLYTHAYRSQREADRFVRREAERLLTVGEDTPVYLWLNERDSEGYLNLLYFARLFVRFHEVYLIRCHTEEDLRNEAYEENDSFAGRRRLTRRELLAMTEEFGRIQRAGGDHRIGRFGEIRVFSEEYLADLLLKEVTDGYETLGNIYCRVRERFEAETGYILPFDTVTSIAWRLMTAGRIESRERCMWWGREPHDAIIGMQWVRRCDPSSLSYRGGDGLRILCDALGEGDTLPLYEALADGAVLDFEWETAVRGKRAIIETIERGGVERVHIEKCDVSCDIFRVAESEKYGGGDRVLLLTCRERGGEVDRYVIKVEGEGGRIEKILVRSAFGPLDLVAEEQ